MPIQAFGWLIAAIGLIALEAMTFNMVSIWFALGSAAALISCLVTDSFTVQAVVFLAVSILCLLAFKPLSARLRRHSTPTNGDRNLGRTAAVLTPIGPEGHGRVRLDGVDWNACAAPGVRLLPGENCRVVEIRSTLLVVEPELAPSWTGVK